MLIGSATVCEVAVAVRRREAQGDQAVVCQRYGFVRIGGVGVDNRTLLVERHFASRIDADDEDQRVGRDRTSLDGFAILDEDDILTGQCVDEARVTGVDGQLIIERTGSRRAIRTEIDVEQASEAGRAGVDSEVGLVDHQVWLDSRVHRDRRRIVVEIDVQRAVAPPAGELSLSVTV